MATIVTRAGKGSPLTNNEMDANLNNLNTDKAELSSLATGTGSSLVGFISSGTGAVATTVQANLRQHVSVKDFGAVGDGVADDSPAFTAAIAYAATTPNTPQTVYVPAGTYLLNSTVAINTAVEFVGDGQVTRGTRIQASTSLNSAMFLVTYGAKFRNLTLMGSWNAASTSEVCVNIKGVNDVMFDHVTMYNSQIGVLYDGSVEAFYNTYSNCLFDNTKNAFIKVNNTSAGGVDLIMTTCRFRGDGGNRMIDFDVGLGSIIASDIQMTTTGVVPIMSVYFGTPAPAYGGAQFSNCVFEGASTSSVYINGAALTPWKEMYFTSCLFTGQSGNSLTIGDVNGISCVGCTFSSGSASSNILYIPYKAATRNSFVACRWESNTTGIAVLATDNDPQVTFISPHWAGSSAFFSSNQQVAIEVLGGRIGTAATPIVISGYKNAIKNIQVKGENYGPLQRTTLVGTLDGAGAATVAHGVTNLQTMGAIIQAWYRGGSGEMRPCTIGSIDGTNISVTGGGASAKYRIHIQYLQSPDTAW